MKKYISILILPFMYSGFAYGATCPTGMTDNVVFSGTFVGRDNGGCPTGYVRYDAPDNFFVRFTGFLDTEIAVCPWGQYMNNGTCTPYERGTCPSGYHATGIDVSFDTQSGAGTCVSGYTTWDDVASCSDDSTDSICTTYCGNGYTRLNTSTGLKYKIYSMRQTTPTLNIGTPENRCYINLTTGSGAMNVEYNGSVYHLTD